MRYFDVDADARVLAHCHWQPQPWDHADDSRAARPERVERRALHARHRHQGVRARHERRPAQSAQLRRHRASVGRAVSLRPDGRRPARRRGTERRRRPSGDRRRRLLARRQSRAEAGRRVRGPIRRRRSGGARRCRRSSRSASACARSSGPATSLYQWNFVKDLKRRMRRKERFWPGLFDLSELDEITTVREFDEAYTAPLLRLRRCRGLLPPRQRDARRRSHPRAGA